MKNVIFILFIFLVNICWGAKNTEELKKTEPYYSIYAVKKTAISNNKLILTCNANTSSKEKDKAIVSNKKTVTVYEPIFEPRKIILKKKTA